MDKHIYNFLDTIFGDEVVVTKRSFRTKDEYLISSPKGGPILSFIVHGVRYDDFDDERISLIGKHKVWDMLCGFFSIERAAAEKYVRLWFGDKHNLKKVSDIKKFMI